MPTDREIIHDRLAETRVSVADRFIRCLDGGKGSRDHETRYDAPPGRNYGVYAEASDQLVLLDIDDYAADADADGLSGLADLPPTLEVASPHGGTHRYYAVEPTDDGRLPAAVLTDAFGKPNPNPSWGEVRVANQYVVGPGSQLDGCDKDDCEACDTPDGGSYTIQADREIAPVAPEALVAALGHDPTLAPAESDEDDKTAEPASDATLADSATRAERLSTALDADPKLARLWRGDYSEYGGDRSRAECALAQKLGWWFGNDKAVVRDLMNQAEPDKWAQRPDDSYRESVLEAVDRNTDSYKPGGSPPDTATTERAAATELRATGATPDGGVDVRDGADADTLPDPVTEETVGERMYHEVAVPLDPPADYDGEEIDRRTAVNRVANIYHEEYAWLRPREDTRGWRSTLYKYVDEEGIYEPHGEAEIERMIDRHLGPIVDNQFVNEVVGKVERKARIRAKRLDEPPQRLVVENGILDLTTGELSEHTPGEFHKVKLDVAYDPDAECPAIDAFLHDVVDDSDVPTLYRFIAHSLYRGYPEAKAAMLLGEGANGKTTFLTLVEEFLGEFNVSSESLKKLNEYEWAPARLNGSLANINADMSDQSPDSMGMFKKLTGGDTVTGEVKFEQPIEFENHATLMFACNELPTLNDDTRGNWRRWELIQFPYVFDETDPDAKDPVPQAELEDQLFTDAELAGLLARCVEEIKRWDSDDQEPFFPNADPWETTREKMRRAAEPVYDFAQACLRPSTDEEPSTLPKETVRQAYQKYATQNGLTKLGPEEFGKRLLGLTDFNIEAGRFRDGDGRRQPCYKGIEFTSRATQLLGEHDPEDASQVGLEDASGSSADIDRVKEILRDHGGEAPRGEILAELGERYDVNPDRADDMVTTARKHGATLPPDADGVVRLTE